MPHQIRAEYPLDPRISEVLRTSMRVAGDLAVPVTLVGAMGRDLLLSHVHGIALQRATADVDIALAVQGWEAFEAFCEGLLGDRRFTRALTSPTRLYFRDALGVALPLDVVPFGPGIGTEKFLWPSDPDIEMNVAGYADATAHPETVQVAADLAVDVVSLAGLAILKLYAWIDRRKETRRDSEDLAALIRHYVDAGNFSRLYDDHSEVLEAVEYDVDRASPYLLGVDMAAIATAATKRDLDAVFEDEAMMTALAIDLSRSVDRYHSDIVQAMALIADVRSGLSHRRNQVESPKTP